MMARRNEVIFEMWDFGVTCRLPVLLLLLLSAMAPKPALDTRLDMRHVSRLLIDILRDRLQSHENPTEYVYPRG